MMGSADDSLSSHRSQVTNLSDILVPHTADLLDVGGALRHVLEGNAGELELVLLVFRRLNVDARVHDDPPDDLLANEVTDFPHVSPACAPAPWSPTDAF